MWTLTSKKTGNIYYILSEKEKHVVGRAASDLVLLGDTSISRTHASLYPSKDSIKVVDTGSKYGTFYNENIDNKVAMPKNVPVELKNGERIQFGVLNNEWVLSKLNICTLTSTLTAVHKTELDTIFDTLEGRITNTWLDSCTHLTMSEITVTLKVLQALVENIPIVSLEFWRCYLSQIREKKSPPKPADYSPKIAESFLNKENISFGIAPTRKTLFSGKTFVFMSKSHFDKYRPIITTAGGVCENLYKGVPKQMLVKKSVIVVQNIQSSQSQCSQAVDNIADLVKRSGRRLIPDSEIGLAILHCSTTKYCNPEYNPVNEFIVESQDEIPLMNIIAKDTPSDKDYDFLVPSEKPLPIEIPESVDYLPPMKKSKKETIAENIPEIVESTANDVISRPTRSTRSNSKVECPQSGKRKQTSPVTTQKAKKPNKGTEEKSEEVSASKNCLPSTSKKSPKSVDIVNKNWVPSENLFSNQLSMTPNVTETTSSSKSTEMHIESSQAQKNAKSLSINLHNFLDKSKIVRPVDTETNTTDHEVPETQSQQDVSKKRARLALICSDDDDDDLFAFGNSDPKKPKQNPQKAQETLFAFGMTSNTRSKGKKQTQTEKTVSQKPPEPIVPRKPIKKLEITTEGWLSKSFSKVKVKSEEETNDEKEEKYDKDTSSWIQSIKGAFEVRVKTMSLTAKTPEVSTICDEYNQNSNINGKNFKAFVKRRNYLPQREVISTVPVLVGLKVLNQF